MCIIINMKESERKAGFMEDKIVYSTDNKVKLYSSEEDIMKKLEGVIGPKFVEYRRKWELTNKFELETEFPLYLQLELHQICNLKCPMCAIGDPEANSKYIDDTHMDWETYKKIILEAEKYGCPSLNPQGTNEPLLVPNFEDYIKFASQHGFIDIMMNSNATLLTEERSRKLLDSGVTRISFSLDAHSKETFEKIRIGADFDNVIKNIERFMEIKKEGNYELPVVGVSFCKMKVNEDELDDFINRWSEKVDFIKVQNFIPPELAHDYSQFIPTDSEYVQDILSGFNCQQPWQRVYVHNSGEVCPCCTFFNEELSLGNISENTIHELWNSDKMKSLRNIHKKGNYDENPWCKSCVKGTCGIIDEKEFIEIRNSTMNQQKTVQK